MNLVNMKQMLIDAEKGHYAVPQFNVWNLEWISAVLDECQELQTPVILGVSQNGAKYMGGFYVVTQLIKAYIQKNNITIPVAIHLDHAFSYEACKGAIDEGFTSVMIDASKHPFEENIAITKKVVEYAHARGISVESELGKIGGKEDQVIAESFYANKDECKTMVDETGIDALAPALGSQHGIYKGEPKLGFKEMDEIHNLVKIPLVLHGGSGIPDDQIRRAISLGTAKINVNTDCLCAWVKIVHEIIKDNPDEIDPRKIIGPGKKGIQEVIKNRCEVFGSIGKGKING